MGLIIEAWAWFVTFWKSLGATWQVALVTGVLATIGILNRWRQKRKKLRAAKEKLNVPQTTPSPETMPKPVKAAPASVQIIAPEDPKLKVDISRLPVTDAKLFGRDKDVAMLHKAWGEGDTNIVTLIAMGGTGKTALLNRWLGELGNEYGGAERVFVWSFYRQGASSETQTSADLFFDEALKWFGYKGDPIPSPHDKGLKLADYVKQHKTLLILDGLEPLQHAPGALHGALKDQGLQSLITQLSGQNPGMLLISSRVPVYEIHGKTEPAVIKHKLSKLNRKDGAEFLESMGVTGTKAELEKAVGEFGGHALALKLLGKWLGLGDGKITSRGDIPPLIEQPDEGGHAMRVMAAYESQLADTADLAGLFIIGLFDRPAPEGAIEALIAEPAIEGLTDRLVNLKSGEWQNVLKHLRELGLLSESDENDKALDAHPLVREYFSARLKKTNRSAFIQAHSRLYEYYKDIAEPLPETLLEMEPLFAAIAHGCAAGQHQEIFKEVYYKRVLRGSKTDFLCKQLGGFGADLAALSSFFAAPWQTVEVGLTAPYKAFALNAAGFRLRALGRLREAAEPMQAGLDMDKSRGDWKNAAVAAGNLSELYLTLGDVKQAINYALDSVTFADKSSGEFEIMVNRTIHADALHQAGQLDEALALFKQAETMQGLRQKEHHFLYSVQGYRYCDLLLSMGQYGSVTERATQTLKWGRENYASLLDVALDTLSLGRAELARIIEANGKDFTPAADYIEKAVNGLREAGQQQYLPSGLLARAECYRHQKQYPKAEDDLTEVFDIAERSGMLLHLTDAQLEAARLARVAGKTICGHGADYHIGKAATLIAKTGYKRREPELEALQAG